MRISNRPGGSTGGQFSDLLRLQAEFQSRLAEETLRYLRRLQGAAAPASPGTVLVPEGSVGLSASGAPGTSVELRLEVENRQRVHCAVTPMLSPQVGASGVTWFPEAELSPVSMLLAPQEVATLSIKLRLPNEIPPGTYRGALMLQGFRDGAISVTTVVSDRSRREAGPAPENGGAAIAAGRIARKPRAGKAAKKTTRRPAKPSPRATGKQS